jgi:transcriptional regulator with XRE-family HTH domain
MPKGKFSRKPVARQHMARVHNGGHLLTEDTMATGPSPTVRRRQLGMELRRLREASGKSQQDAGEWLGIPATSISKIETGKQRVSQAYLRLLLQLYAVGSPHAEALDLLRKESDQRAWFAEYGKTVPSWFSDYLGFETAAAEVWTYQPEFIPGLLQTPEYAEAINVALSPDRAADEIQRLVQLRTSRQQRLTTEDDRLTLRAVINEAALRREVGGPDVMRAQARRLAELAKLPNVTVLVLPFTAGAHPGMRGAFTALRFPEEPMNTVYQELYGAALYVEAPAEVRKFADDFEQLVRQSLSADGTTQLLDQIEGRP